MRGKKMGPTQGDQSCLVSKLRHFVELSEQDNELLIRFEEEQREYKKRDLVRAEGDPIEDLFVVKKGWFIGYTTLQNGKRQVHRLYLPGDLIGTHEVVCERATYDVAATSDGILCPFQKIGLRHVFSNSPRLTALLYSIEALEQVAQDDRFRAVARMDATGRLSYLLLQIVSRLRLTEDNMHDRLKLLINQELIGDMLGLTGIHVNRTLKYMKEIGLIDRTGSVINLLQEDRMKELASFDDRHYKIDTSWFPPLIE
ncbi:Crp/Fnr family transcriptional regulator [Pacificimonas sp. ICDLI1SI03]